MLAHHSFYTASYNQTLLIVISLLLISIIIKRYLICLYIFFKNESALLTTFSGQI